MKIKARHLTLIVLSALCTISAKTNVATEEICIEPDHYLVYPLNAITSPISGSVTLSDQFFTGELFFNSYLRLLNPATKWHDGQISIPARPDTHYVAVRVVPDADSLPDFRTSIVNVFNQFGDYTFSTYDDFVYENDFPVVDLLVPSLKKACNGDNCDLEEIMSCPGCFPEGDHYLCYELNVTDTCPISARFEDQFLKNREVEGLTPKRLCNPADKNYRNVWSISSKAETNHLLCYEVDAKNLPLRLVNLLNQLGQQKGYVVTNDEICVPSTKVDITEPRLGFVTGGTTDGDIIATVNLIIGDLLVRVEPYDCSVSSYNQDEDLAYDNDGDSGVEAADCYCRIHAYDANLLCPDGGFGCWKAWIADINTASAPANRFNMASPPDHNPIYQVDENGKPDLSKPIALGGWADLVNCSDDPFEGSNCLDSVFNINQAGSAVTGEENWTNVLTNGSRNGTNFTDTCTNWSSNISTDSGQYGTNTSQNDIWTVDNTDSCEEVKHLYCFQDF